MLQTFLDIPTRLNPLSPGYSYMIPFSPFASSLVGESMAGCNLYFPLACLFTVIDSGYRFVIYFPKTLLYMLCLILLSAVRGYYIGHCHLYRNCRLFPPLCYDR